MVLSTALVEVGRGTSIVFSSAIHLNYLYYLEFEVSLQRDHMHKSSHFSAAKRKCRRGFENLNCTYPNDAVVISKLSYISHFLVWYHRERGSRDLGSTSLVKMARSL